MYDIDKQCPTKLILSLVDFTILMMILRARLIYYNIKYHSILNTISMRRYYDFYDTNV